MRKAKEIEGRNCPECGKVENQRMCGKNHSGTQRCFCTVCKKHYTLDPKKREIPEEVRNQAIKTYYAGASGRGVGKIFGFSKANVYNWIKKTTTLELNYHNLELDELYHFVERKGTTETRENCYVIALVSRQPRQIVGIDAAFDKSPERIQALVDAAPPAKNYCTDGYFGYIDVVYPGKHVRNIRDKSDTFTVESVNADLRHYIPLLRRRSRCFPCSLDTLLAVLEVFADAYNAFGVAKMKFRHGRDPVRELPFSVLDFLQVRDWPQPFSRST